MGGRRFESLNAKQLLELKEVLEKYAVYCGETAKQIENSTIYTDGYTATKKGLFSLRNLLAKQLGKLAVKEPEIVSEWDYRAKPKKATAIRLNTAAESPPVYDLTQGNPSIKQQAKAIKAIDKKATQAAAAKKKAKPSKPDKA